MNITYFIRPSRKTIKTTSSGYHVQLLQPSAIKLLNIFRKYSSVLPAPSGIITILVYNTNRKRVKPAWRLIEFSKNIRQRRLRTHIARQVGNVFRYAFRNSRARHWGGGGEMKAGFFSSQTSRNSSSIPSARKRTRSLGHHNECIFARRRCCCRTKGARERSRGKPTRRFSRPKPRGRRRAGRRRVRGTRGAHTRARIRTHYIKPGERVARGRTGRGERARNETKRNKHGRRTLTIP